MNLLAVLEGILFVVGDEGIDLESLNKIMEIKEEEIISLLEQLKQEYLKENRGMTLEILGNTYKLVTKKEHHIYYERFLENEEIKVLSQAALETLAIIVYNEPITRVQIDEIRGVSSAHIVRKLLLRELIEECGRSELPGRPTLLKTTSKFYDYFGLKGKEELPTIDMPQEVKDEEINLFESKYKEI